MENYKQMLAGQIELILSIYNPYVENLNDQEKGHLEDFTKCLEILKKE